jgi:hypothetical protein
MLCTDEIIQQVWEKGIVVPNNDKNKLRQDQCGAWISRSAYGRQQSIYGWEINYIHPQARKDGQNIANLRPMQWKNNSHKQGDDTVCVLKAVGIENRNITPVSI